MADYKEILNRATAEASDFINNPSRMDALLADLEAKMREIPVIGETVAELPVMVSLVKSWIKKEYQVNVKVLAAIVGAFLYLVKKKDLISDNIPVVGIADDIAVLGLALKLVAPDVQAYRDWKAQRGTTDTAIQA